MKMVVKEIERPAGELVRGRHSLPTDNHHDYYAHYYVFYVVQQFEVVITIIDFSK